MALAIASALSRSDCHIVAPVFTNSHHLAPWTKAIISESDAAEPAAGANDAGASRLQSGVLGGVMAQLVVSRTAFAVATSRVRKSPLRKPKTTTHHGHHAWFVADQLMDRSAIVSSQFPMGSANQTLHGNAVIGSWFHLGFMGAASLSFVDG
jgi:hypothetical protein